MISLDYGVVFNYTVVAEWNVLGVTKLCFIGFFPQINCTTLIKIVELITIIIGCSENRLCRLFSPQDFEIF